MMTNKQSQVAKALFLSGTSSSNVNEALTQVVLPLCGGVVGEAIAPPIAEVAQNLRSDQASSHLQPVPVTPTLQWLETAIALVISGTILAWLTTLPLGSPQPRLQTYTTTLSNATQIADY